MNGCHFGTQASPLNSIQSRASLKGTALALGRTPYCTTSIVSRPLPSRSSVAIFSGDQTSSSTIFSAASYASSVSTKRSSRTKAIDSRALSP